MDSRKHYVISFNDEKYILFDVEYNHRRITRIASARDII